jgi:hypothetical protein
MKLVVCLRPQRVPDSKETSVKKVAILLLGIALPPGAHAAYDDDILQPWVGATQDELAAGWGYPQSANDYVKIDEEITIFTYRSFRGGIGGSAVCVVSFTLRSKVVVGWRREGENCPRNKRASRR